MGGLPDRRGGIHQRHEIRLSNGRKGDAAGQPAQVGLSGQWLDGRIYDIGLEPLRQEGREAVYRIRVMFQPHTDALLRAGLPAVLRLNTL